MSTPPDNPESVAVGAPSPPASTVQATRWSTVLRRWITLRITPDPELDEDNRFAFTQDEMVAQLHTEDADRAQELLEEAFALSARMVEDRTDSVERRAATLQSATAIAGAFSLAGGTLVVTHVHGRPWQTLIGGLLVWVTGNLGLCGWRATQASSSVIHRWSVLPTTGILHRTEQTLAESRVERAAQVLRAAGWNARYARFKVTMLRRAGRHLSRATLGLPVLVAAIVVYALRH